jgi:hypothetical protein
VIRIFIVGLSFVWFRLSFQQFDVSELQRNKELIGFEPRQQNRRMRTLRGAMCRCGTPHARNLTELRDPRARTVPVSCNLILSPRRCSLGWKAPVSAPSLSHVGLSAHRTEGPVCSAAKAVLQRGTPAGKLALNNNRAQPVSVLGHVTNCTTACTVHCGRDRRLFEVRKIEKTGDYDVLRFAETCCQAQTAALNGSHNLTKYRTPSASASNKLTPQFPHTTRHWP